MLNLILAAAAVWAAVTAALFAGQRALLYFPDTTTPAAPILAAAGFEPLPVDSEGLQLTAWMKRPADATQLTLVLFQGNGGHLAHRLPLVQPLLRGGEGVVLAAYPGYGGNPGRPNEASLYAAGRATIETLAARGIGSERVVLWGESLGGGIATLLATERRFAGVILQAPFTSVADRAQEVYPLVPARLLTLDRFDNLSRIAAIGAPLLIIQGEADRVIPAHHGRRLLDAAREPKQGVFLPGADHNDLHAHGVLRHLRDFLARLPQQP